MWIQSNYWVATTQNDKAVGGRNYEYFEYGGFSHFGIPPVYGAYGGWADIDGGDGNRPNG